MFPKVYYVLVCVLFGVAVSIIVNTVEAQTNDTINTFKDPKTGITLQYPSNWQVASKEYTNSIYGNSEDMADTSQSSGTTSPIVMLVPESLSGSSFAILSEILPFPLSLEKYFESTKRSFLLSPEVSISDPVPVSLGGLNALKYNVSYSDLPDFVQTQTLFVKDSKGFIIASTLVSTEQSNESLELNSITNSVKFNNLKKANMDVNKELV
jgi:hypothetical protein